MTLLIGALSAWAEQRLEAIASEPVEVDYGTFVAEEATLVQKG